MDLGDVSIPVRTAPCPSTRIEGPMSSTCHQVTSWAPWAGVTLGAHLWSPPFAVRCAAGAVPCPLPGLCKYPVTELCLGTMPSWYLRLSGTLDLMKGSFPWDTGHLISFSWNLTLECCDIRVHQTALRVYPAFHDISNPHLNNSLYWFIKPLKQISLQTTLAVPPSLDFTESGL